jgi:CRISPR-associated Csx10 family RAMP protein
MAILIIRALGPLLVAGDASASGADLATARRRVGDLLVPYIPATALRGAVRIQMEALLRGTGKPVVDPYPLDEPGSAVPEDDLIASLFGYSGPADEREQVVQNAKMGAREGLLRFGDALPLDPRAAAEAIRVRPGLEIDDDLGAAADRKLYFRELVELGTDLIFHAPLDHTGIEGESLKALKAAVAATDSLGAGKSKGGGAIEIRWLEGDAPQGVSVVQGGAEARRARLLITLLEPARFGDGGPLGNHQGTRAYIPGATLWGAIAWTLLRHHRTVPESKEFRALFLDPQAARFGDALPVGSEQSEPVVAPATLQEDRKSESRTDVLVHELARDRVESVLKDRQSLLALRADDGDQRLDPVDDCRGAKHLVRRTRTRVSIDRESGTAADSRLFSIDQIEPTDREGLPVRFVSWIEGISPAGVELLSKLEGLPIALGSGRNHGLGAVAMEVRLLPEVPERRVKADVHALTREVDREARELARRAGLRLEDVGQDRPLLPLLALVAQSDYVWTDPEKAHPLDELGERQEEGGVTLVRRFFRSAQVGGFDQRPDRNGPLKPLLPAIGAGSVFVYELATEALAGLADILASLRRGVGQRTEWGCGRFALHSIHGPQGAKE